MDFVITKKNKKKARRNRVRHENKWMIFRIFYWLFLCVSVVSFVIGIFFVSDTSYDKLERYGIIFSISMVLAVITKGLLTNLASHWIQDRLNERMWMENNNLYHFQQVAFAAGLNSRHADATGYTFSFSMDSIREVKYDEKSKRIEFVTDGNGVHYSDVRRKIVDMEWPLNEYKAVFYDYFEPSLISVLEKSGKNIEKKTINNYSILDNRI